MALFGSPGKLSGLLLRIGQCFSAAASIGFMVSAHGFFNSTAFWYCFPSIILVTAILSLAAACSSAGVTVLYSRDLGYCKSPQIPCSHFKASILFAFISWFLLAISSHVTFWLLAAV
ncbi:hypothetical protein Goshw_026011 [Gossypium schwendimanii]|uniref:CASP-like protein n=1 Tax=Gossypium schwendimanii TaxID=34291 RepID=A0A7J9MK17_GOSSC|nr:hypothetical protein [Gossypium schwendimanii]